ncbi:hypothetical protein KY337_05780 [Candidatus Woesearchaeota archaeon]|nr:hypothetical protein [Candidatus Woesearchaeota archaeon]
MNKYLIIIAIFLTISLFSCYVSAETETPIGTFTIGNAAPEPPYGWTPDTTHDKDQAFSWTEGSDPNSDPVSTYICITNDTDDDSCSVVNTGPNADPAYTFTQVESNWDYLWGSASRTYYVKLTPSDGTSNGTANDTISFTLTDAIPTISGQTSDASNDGDKDVGETVTFSMSSHGDTDASDNHSLLVCRTDSISTSGLCASGQEICNQTALTFTDDSSLTCTYAAQDSDGTSLTAYFFVCDCPPNDDSCPGQCSASSSHTFYVNHAPSASSVDITPDTPSSSQTLTCNYTFSDATDSDSEGTSTFKWYNYSGGGSWQLTGFTDSTLASSNTGANEVWMCEVTPVDEHSFAGTAVNSTNETISNTVPNPPTDFQIQDGESSWDSTEFSTHDVTPNMQWSTSDNDSDSITTYVCVATTSGNRDSWTCVYDSSTGTDSVTGVTGLDYSGTNTTYYVRLVPNDGSENGSALDIEFNLSNQLPLQPSGLSPTSTHNQTPSLTWTATDPDDGSDDGWPADSLTYHLRVGTSYSDATYESNENADKTGETVDSAIPWGAPGDIDANSTVYVQLWTTDGNTGGNSSEYNTTLVLTDSLPDITNIELTDSGSAYSSCTAATCALTPIEHSNATVAVRITATDTDDDCDEGSNSEANIYLCIDTNSCDEDSYNYTWEVDSVSRSGSTCTYIFTDNKSAGDSTPEFFQLPNANYKLHVNVSSQAGKRLSDAEENATWEYATLKAIDYPSSVTLGDGTIVLDQWNNGTSLATMANWGNDNLNIQWSITDPTSGTDNWTIVGDDFQIDDDNIQSEELTGYLSPVYLNGTDQTFEPGTGLEVCADATCSDSGLNETLATYFHIKPPAGLQAGTYNTTITITIS